MKARTKIILALGAVALTGFILYATRRQKSNHRLDKVADEGYETAHDILFPSKSRRGKKLRYGPVTR
jgi:hypothetical protein